MVTTGTPQAIASIEHVGDAVAVAVLEHPAGEGEDAGAAVLLEQRVPG